MRIGFFVQGTGIHWEVAKYLIASAQRLMPEVPLFQLTDEKTPEIDGAEALRIGGELPMGVRRLMHYAREGEWCFVDTDVLFKRDVRGVFEKPFDVALASRDGTYMQGSSYAEVMPYNFGVVFSRNPKFWEVALHHLKRFPLKLQEWEGEQLVTCELARRKLFQVEILPSTFNFTPEKKTDDLSNVSVLHLKGARKAWLPELAL